MESEGGDDEEHLIDPIDGREEATEPLPAIATATPILILNAQQSLSLILITSFLLLCLPFVFYVVGGVLGFNGP